MLPFTPTLAQVSAADFVAQVLVGTLHAAAVVVGSAFTFGHRGAGDVATLQRLGQEHWFTAHGVGLLPEVDAPCSSTFARGCLRRGDVRAAARALGGPHCVDGVLASAGVRVGELVVAADTAVPAAGRYAGRLAGAQPVDLEVTADGRVLVISTGPTRGRAGVDFLTRLDG